MEVASFSTPDSWPYRKPALVVGHPGHELKVFGWALKYKPKVYVLTDGSGRGEVSRVPATAKQLEDIGATKGDLFGVISDRDFYVALQEQRKEFFLTITERLASSFVQNDIDSVVADAIEGYNPAHDLCRTIVEAAIRLATQETGKAIADYDFRLTEEARQALHDERCLHLQLDDALLQQKIDASLRYAEMRDEVERAMGQHGTEYFRVECLRKVIEPFPGWPNLHKPAYEIYGEQRVAQGAYASPIRYRQHILPLIEAIRKFASAGVAPTLK